MSNMKIILALLIFLNIQYLTLAQVDPTPIPINHSDEVTDEKYFVVNYSEDDLKDINYVIISTKVNNINYPGFIYVSLTEKNPSPEKRDYTSQNLGKNEVIMNASSLKGKTSLYINLHPLKSGQIIQFEVKTAKNIELSISEDKRRFKISDVDTVYYTPTEDEYKRKIMLYSSGERVEYFSMSVIFKAESGQKQEFKPEQKFDNGYGVIIDLNKLNSGTFEIKISPSNIYPALKNSEKFVGVGMDYTENNGDPIKLIEMMEHVFGYISDKQNCYYINDLLQDKDFTIAINVYNQALTFVYYKGQEITYSLDIFHNSYIKLTPSIFLKNSHFCFKKYTPKEKTEEELGEISFDFQAYYDDDLPNIQSFLFPLVNGHVYKNSMKNDQIMVYRHSSFSGSNFKYSATLTQLRGKPTLYGYKCETYPDCNLDMNKFKEMKEKGNIDVIHKINNYYVNKRDLSKYINDDEGGDESAQTRNQYLSVVICESGTDLPNYGECQYTIEIDSYDDEIQLVPELVHANSVLFLNNSYRIRIADYKNTQYLKIYFTIISGNANLDIYSDSEHNNDISSTFNYRHVHRKEIFEKTGEIAENYYLLIKTTDPAFIEIKYETNFHYKGYIKLNPNELNIEYLNKNDKFSPYSIVNPDYFYPINNPKNNDFYYSIWTLDCGVVYKENFNDEYNVTIKHHEVSKYDINFGSSYGFELKLQSYFHTPVDDKEDCTILIYTGEKSKDYPLLITDDMFHPSNLKETYYIYPFTITSELNCIFVQVQFDKNSIAQMTESPKVKVTFKIDNQNAYFDEYTITQDTSFVVKKETIKQYCPYNFYQCSLTVEVVKIDKNEIPYIVLTGIHSSLDTVEFVRKNRVYSYNLRPKDSRYFYTQIDKDEEGEINFMFNKGNGRVFAKMVEKTTVDKGANWNRRVLLPDINSKDLLYNDYPNNVIKYSAKDFNGCQKGCELYFLIQSDQETKEESLLTHVTFNIDQKWQTNENGVNEFFSLNKYIKGTIEENKYKYYTITIPLKYQKISINLNSPSAKAYIKLGKSHYCKKEDAIWEVTPSMNFGRVIITANDPKIKADSLKGISFSIGVAKMDGVTLNVYNRFYYLEVQGLYNNDKPYYLLNSERSLLCDTGDSNYCHGLFYINKKYNTGKNLLYSWTTDYKDTVTMYASVFSADKIESKSLDESIENMFPSLTMYDQKTEGKYMFINYTRFDKEKDIYLLMSFYTKNKNSKIRLIMSGVPSSKVLLPYGTERLILLSDFIKFYLPYDYKNRIGQYYSLTIRTLKSPQKIKINDIENELSGKYFSDIKSQEFNRSFQINYTETEDKEQGLLIWYTPTRNDKLFYVEKDLKNEVLIEPGKSFPQYIIIDLTYNKTMKIEALFHDIQYQNEKKSEDKFKISGYVIDKDLLAKRMRDPTTKIEGEVIEGNYSTINDNATLYIKRDKIKNDTDYFLYAIIEKDPENKNEYKSVVIQYSPEFSEAPDDKKDDDDDKGDDGIYYIEAKYVIIFVCCFIAAGLIVAILAACICAKMNKGKNKIITIDNNDVNASLGLSKVNNDDSLIPKND